MIRVVDGSGAGISGAAVTLDEAGTPSFSGTTDDDGLLFATLKSSGQALNATVQTTGQESSTYSNLSRPSAVLEYTGISGTGVDATPQSVEINIAYSQTEDGVDEGSFKSCGAGIVDNNTVTVPVGETVKLDFMPVSGYRLTGVSLGGAPISDSDAVAAASRYSFTAAAEMDQKTLLLTFSKLSDVVANLNGTSIFDIHYTADQVFDCQRSPAFPDSGSSAIRFSGLKAPYDNQLKTIAMQSGEYVYFEKVSSVDTAGLTDGYESSLKYWSDASDISTAAVVKEWKHNTDQTETELGTGLIWCVDETKGFLFTALDGRYGSSGGIGTYVSFNALRYGSSATLLTDTDEPLQWGGVDNAKGKSINPNGDHAMFYADATFDFACLVLNKDTLQPVPNMNVVLVLSNSDYLMGESDASGHAVFSDLSFTGDTDYQVIVADDLDNPTLEAVYSGTLPEFIGVGSDATLRANGSTPAEIVLLLPSSGVDDSGTIQTTPTITVSSDGSGTVSPGSTTVVSGKDARFVFTPDNGGSVSEVKVDGIANTQAVTDGFFKFNDVTEAHTLSVTFAGGSSQTYLLTVSNGGTGATASGSYAPGASVTINAGTKPGYTFSGWTTSNGGAFASASSANTTFTMPTAATTITANWIDSGDTDSSGTSGKADPIYVDGTEHDIGSQTVSGDKTTVTVDQTKLQAQIDKASESVLVPVSDKTNTAVAQLVVKNVEDMAKKEMTLSVRTGDVTYQMPTTAVDTEKLMTALGATDPSKVPISVTITNLAAGSATTDKGTVVLNPVEFSVTAAYGGKTVELDRFEQYVQRVLELPVGYDASKITTAIRVEDGEHVPTKVYQKDGKYYATINSLTNSTYVLILNQQSFADASGKWYAAAADEMASRCVIFGRSNGKFDGEANVTRAEFAAMIVRALGLPETGDSNFSDVSGTAWCAGAIGAASEYGIIYGYTDGSFRPNQNITRQEAMAILQRAAKVAEFAGSTGSLPAFSDAGSVGAWAKEAVAFNVGSGLIVGKSNGTLSPLSEITRAETAVTILRFLQKAELVDVRSKT